MLPFIKLGERQIWTFENRDDKMPIKINVSVFGNELINGVETPKIDKAGLDLFYNVEMLFGWFFGISLGVVLSQKIARE